MSSKLKMVHKKDPKEEIFEAVGTDIKDCKVFGNRVLVGVYQRPDKTLSGIVLPDKTRDEDKYQGKVGLVLKLGSLAFQDTSDSRWDAAEVAKVGDWVLIRSSDGLSTELGGKLCRIVRDSEIQLTVPEPDYAY